MDERKIERIRDATNHPQTRGKIERWRQTMKNSILQENYDLLHEMEKQNATLVDDYNLRRLHESLDIFSPADIYSGRDQAILG